MEIDTVGGEMAWLGHLRSLQSYPQAQPWLMPLIAATLQVETEPSVVVEVLAFLHQEGAAELAAEGTGSLLRTRPLLAKAVMKEPPPHTHATPWHTR